MHKRKHELVEDMAKSSTLVFAAIQFEVSLSSSHFLIHFLSHCARENSFIFTAEQLKSLHTV